MNNKRKGKRMTTKGKGRPPTSGDQKIERALLISCFARCTQRLKIPTWYKDGHVVINYPGAQISFALTNTEYELFFPFLLDPGGPLFIEKVTQAEKNNRMKNMFGELNLRPVKAS